jgi:hypothetical protein
VRYPTAWTTGRTDAAIGCLLEYMGMERMHGGNEDKQCGSWMCESVKKVLEILGKDSPSRLAL